MEIKRKKIILTENQLTDILEMAYPNSWNIEDFKKLNSYASRMKYCKQHLEYISSGSARAVFKIDDEKVLKLAKNKKGLGQNGVENNSFFQDYEIFAKVFDYDKDDLWLEMELARKCKVSDFKQIIGFDFKFIQNFIGFIADEHTIKRSRFMSLYDKRYEDTFNEILEDETHDWLMEMANYLRDVQLEAIGDLKRINSYGVVKRNGHDAIVVVDYGLNDDSFSTYYSR